MKTKTYSDEDITKLPWYMVTNSFGDSAHLEGAKKLRKLIKGGNFKNLVRTQKEIEDIILETHLLDDRKEANKLFNYLTKNSLAYSVHWASGPKGTFYNGFGLESKVKKDGTKEYRVK